MILYSRLREWLCNWVYKDCIPPSVIAKESMEEFRMTEKRLYKLISKENGCTIGWFTDSEDMFHLIDWYDVNTKYEVYKLEKVVE